MLVRVSRVIDRGGCVSVYSRVLTGGLAERLNAAVLKTVRSFRGLGGSNPSPSANITTVSEHVDVFQVYVFQVYVFQVFDVHMFDMFMCLMLGEVAERLKALPC